MDWAPGADDKHLEDKQRKFEEASKLPDAYIDSRTTYTVTDEFTDGLGIIRKPGDRAHEYTGGFPFGSVGTDELPVVFENDRTHFVAVKKTYLTSAR